MAGQEGEQQQRDPAAEKTSKPLVEEDLTEFADRV
jgi:hypothetical protein